MSKADGKCNKCKGTGMVDSPVAHLGIPGLCFRCDGIGTYEAEAAIKARGKKLKAEQEIARKWDNKIYEVMNANKNVPKMNREERHWAHEAQKFSTQEFADAFGYSKSEAWVKLCVSFGKVVLDYDQETGIPKGWSV